MGYVIHCSLNCWFRLRLLEWLYFLSRLELHLGLVSNLCPLLFAKKYKSFAKFKALFCLLRSLGTLHRYYMFSHATLVFDSFAEDPGTQKN